MQMEGLQRVDNTLGERMGALWVKASNKVYQGGLHPPKEYTGNNQRGTGEKSKINKRDVRISLCLG